MKLALIAAVAENRGIGLNKTLPWHLPDDYAYFKNATEHHLLIMGRQTFESLPRPLPNRIHVVITSQSAKLKGVDWQCASLEEGLMLARDVAPKDTKWIFGIGGERIFSDLLPVADRLYLTEVAASPEVGRYFPQYDPACWQEVSREHHEQDERHRYAFDYVVYDRIEMDLN